VRNGNVTTSSSTSKLEAGGTDPNYSASSTPKFLELEPTSILDDPYQVREQSAQTETDSSAEIDLELGGSSGGNSNSNGQGSSSSSFEELVQSIRALGVRQPIEVEEIAPQRYKVVTGHRRLAAARVLKLPTIPCMVRLPGIGAGANSGSGKSSQTQTQASIVYGRVLVQLAENQVRVGMDVLDQAIALKMGKVLADIQKALDYLELVATTITNANGASIQSASLRPNVVVPVAPSEVEIAGLPSNRHRLERYERYLKELKALLVSDEVAEVLATIQSQVVYRVSVPIASSGSDAARRGTGTNTDIQAKYSYRLTDQALTAWSVIEKASGFSKASRIALLHFLQIEPDIVQALRDFLGRQWLKSYIGSSQSPGAVAGAGNGDLATDAASVSLNVSLPAQATATLTKAHLQAVLAVKGSYRREVVFAYLNWLKETILHDIDRDLDRDQKITGRVGNTGAAKPQSSRSGTKIQATQTQRIKIRRWFETKEVEKLAKALEETLLLAQYSSLSASTSTTTLPADEAETEDEGDTADYDEGISTAPAAAPQLQAFDEGFFQRLVISTLVTPPLSSTASAQSLLATDTRLTPGDDNYIEDSDGDGDGDGDESALENNGGLGLGREYSPSQRRGSSDFDASSDGGDRVGKSDFAKAQQHKRTGSRSGSDDGDDEDDQDFYGYDGNASGGGGGGGYGGGGWQAEGDADFEGPATPEAAFEQLSANVKQTLEELVASGRVNDTMLTRLARLNITDRTRLVEIMAQHPELTTRTIYRFISQLNKDVLFEEALAEALGEGGVETEALQTQPQAQELERTSAEKLSTAISQMEESVTGVTDILDYLRYFTPEGNGQISQLPEPHGVYLTQLLGVLKQALEDAGI
jgi:hypothetical protein